MLPNAEPRLVKQDVTIGGHTYPEGSVLILAAALVHTDPRIYPAPHAFRPERFLDTKPGTYTWIPFGGGRRRCLGASFALLEMRLVLRAASERFTIHTAGPPQPHPPPHDHDHARRRRARPAGTPRPAAVDATDAEAALVA